MVKKKKEARGKDGARQQQDSKRQERRDRAAHRKQRQKNKYGKQYTDDELFQFREELSRKGFTLRESKGDGNCFFRSASIQLTGSEASHFEVREGCIDYIEANPDVFLPFIEDEDESFAEYCIRMRGDAEWGGQPELMALSWSRTLNVMVHQLSQPSYLVECGQATAPVIHLSYHDGNHYNSVHPDVTAAAMTLSLLQGGTSGAGRSAATTATTATTGAGSVTKGAPAGTDEAMVMASTGLEDMSRIKAVLDDMGGDVTAAVQFIDVELQAEAEAAILIAATQDESAPDAAMMMAMMASESAEVFEAAAPAPENDGEGGAAAGEAVAGDGAEAHGHAAAAEKQQDGEDGEGGEGGPEYTAPGATSGRATEKRMTKRDKKKKKREQKRTQQASRGASTLAEAEAAPDDKDGNPGWDVLRV